MDDLQYVMLVVWLLAVFGSVGICDRGWSTNDPRVSNPMNLDRSEGRGADEGPRER